MVGFEQGNEVTNLTGSKFFEVLDKYVNWYNQQNRMSAIIDNSDQNPLMTSLSNPYFISESSRCSLHVEDLV